MNIHARYKYHGLKQRDWIYTLNTSKKIYKKRKRPYIMLLKLSLVLEVRVRSGESF